MFEHDCPDTCAVFGVLCARVLHLEIQLLIIIIIVINISPLLPLYRKGVGESGQ